MGHSIRSGIFACISCVRLKVFLRFELPALAAFTVSFLLSTDWFAAHVTQSYLAWLFGWVATEHTSERIRNSDFILRKVAHAVEYILLTWFLHRACRRSHPRAWSWPRACTVLVIMLLWAASDEIHQTFTRYRYASVTDFFIDAGGVIAGLALLYLRYHIFSRLRNAAI
ncbi:MAG: hypothetical protein C4297_10055 [Gemmataceae bacterium]